MSFVCELLSILLNPLRRCRWPHPHLLTSSPPSPSSSLLFSSLHPLFIPRTLSRISLRFTRDSCNLSLTFPNILTMILCEMSCSLFATNIFFFFSSLFCHHFISFSLGFHLTPVHYSAWIDFHLILINYLPVVFFLFIYFHSFFFFYHPNLFLFEFCLLY